MGFTPDRRLGGDTAKDGCQCSWGVRLQRTGRHSSINTSRWESLREFKIGWIRGIYMSLICVKI